MGVQRGASSQQPLEGCPLHFTGKHRASEQLGDLPSLEVLPACLSTPPHTQLRCLRRQFSKEIKGRQSHWLFESDVLGLSCSEVAAGVTSPAPPPPPRRFCLADSRLEIWPGASQGALRFLGF